MPDVLPKYISLTSFQGCRKGMQCSLSGCVKGTVPLSIEIYKRYSFKVFCQNGIEKGKRLDLSAEPPCKNSLQNPLSPRYKHRRENDVQFIQQG